MQQIDRVQQFTADRPYAFRGNVSYPLTRREAKLLHDKASKVGLALWPNPDGLDDAYYPGRFRVVDIDKVVL